MRSNVALQTPVLCARWVKISCITADCQYYLHVYLKLLTIALAALSTSLQNERTYSFQAFFFFFFLNIKPVNLQFIVRLLNSPFHRQESNTTEDKE